MESDHSHSKYWNSGLVIENTKWVSAFNLLSWGGGQESSCWWQKGLAAMNWDLPKHGTQHKNTSYILKKPAWLRSGAHLWQVHFYSRVQALATLCFDYASPESCFCYDFRSQKYTTSPRLLGGENSLDIILFCSTFPIFCFFLSNLFEDLFIV